MDCHWAFVAVSEAYCLRAAIRPDYFHQDVRWMTLRCRDRFCAKHRQDTMVDVLDRHCSQAGCDRQPIYGNPFEQTGRPLWCPSHRPESSFDVKTSRCQEEDCLKHPRFDECVHPSRVSGSDSERGVGVPGSLVLCENFEMMCFWQARG